MRAIVKSLIKHTTRSLLVLALLPAVVLGTLGVEALLIHDHHGHDLHAHGLAIDDVNDWRNIPGRSHEHHEHDGLPEETPDDDGSSIVLVLELPDALLKVRGLSAGNVTAAPFARLQPLIAVAPEPTANALCLDTRPGFAAPDLRAGSVIADILLTNHALLL